MATNEPVAEPDDDLPSFLTDDDAVHSRFEISRDLGKRLDVYLHGRLKGISRSKVKQLIDLGAVKVNDRPSKASFVIKKGDVIDIILPGRASRTIAPEPMPLDILFEDEHLIVINKQADLIVHPARGQLSGTLINGLAHHFKQQVEAAGGEYGQWHTRGFRPGEQTSDAAPPPTRKPGKRTRARARREARGSDFEPDGNVEGLSGVGASDLRPGIIHRLDRFTTGVMVVAKSDEAHWQVARQFENRRVLKCYLAVCHNHPDPHEAPGGVIDQPIGKHPTIREAMAIRHDSTSRDSVTLFRVRERYEGYSLIELELKTGRTHQIRVHLSHMGCPIAGDLLYGGEVIGKPEIESPPRAAGSRRYINYARAKLDGERMEADAAQRDDVLAVHPALHATLLRIYHPIRKEEMTFTAPLHEPMHSLVSELRKHPAPGCVAEDGYWIDLDKAIPG